jgi:hypothetical protein
MSVDGARVFFATKEGLVSEDTNGVADVYEYNTIDGSRSLISSGESNNPSLFLEASQDGRDVFFITTERLSGWDSDNAYDLYDARADGGLSEPSVAPASCQGDACQPVPVVPNDVTPSSSGFAGPGDLAPKRAKQRRKQRRHNHKPQRAKQRHAQANGNRKHG